MIQYCGILPVNQVVVSHTCSATADFSITSLSQASRCSFSLVSNLVWSPRYRLGRSCRGYDIPHWIAYQEVLIMTLVNIEQRVCPDLNFSDVELPVNSLEYYHQLSFLLLLSLIMATHVCCCLCGWGRSMYIYDTLCTRVNCQH